ncbi:energy transducer TonB [Chromobacterium sp. LK11]|uniref:energy transducer TonB n=1 Tax=Chromobacterium sp. LK11 TaxID=1628212 RepID=UPI00069DEE9C|nr:energy transducer TonB [Chromobacterium sp. LK11]
MKLPAAFRQNGSILATTTIVLALISSAMATAAPVEAERSLDPAAETTAATRAPPFRDRQSNNPKPAYPAMSIEEDETGTVQLRVHVSSQGLPQDVSLAKSSGSPRLDSVALDTAKRWRFIPAQRGGKPIPYTFFIPVEFSLKSAKP